MMKCIECGKEAEFVLGGDSCCRKHFENALERLKKEEEEERERVDSY